jgi:demethylmenaquinone methyltransferase / 2-methoxy-6-polyprenyl-1,4-benzoquinol methylase
MFDTVSTHYDRTNAVLSVGNAALWRRATTRAINPQPGERILDIAAGTGTSSVALTRTGAEVVAADFSPGMIEVGRSRHAENPLLEFVQADATALPFDDNEFDVVTISFGLRNVVEPRTALAEFYRVTKPGGRVVICEFSTPPLAPIRVGYFAYLNHVMPTVVKLASSNAEAYDYLGESIAAWPNQKTLSGWLRSAGYTDVAYRNLTFGIVALHRGVKIGDESGAVTSNSVSTAASPTETTS